MRDAFVGVLTELAAQHPELMLLTGDLGFGVLVNFSAQFPRQFLIVGVAEQNMSGLAAGLALEGHSVFTYSIGNFPTLRCLEQIRNDICYHGANVTIVCVGGGMSYGPVGMSHHATEDLAILRSLPGLEVFAPGDLWEASEASRHLASRPHGPAWSASPKIPPAADQLAEQGVRCRVLSVHTVKPLDTATLSIAAAETQGIVSIEEHAVDGGLGGAIAEALMEAGISPGFFVRIGLRNTFSSVVGSQAYLRTVYSIDAASIVRTVSLKLGIAEEAISR